VAKYREQLGIPVARLRKELWFTLQITSACEWLFRRWCAPNGRHKHR
jgi:hypothetical protein